MLRNEILVIVEAIVFLIFALYLFFSYFDIFFTRKKGRQYIFYVWELFFVWQMVLPYMTGFPAYMRMIFSILITFVSVFIMYQGNFWNKIVFIFVFEAIWMMIETLCGYMLSIYLNINMESQLFGILGGFFSKLFFLMFIFALKRTFANDRFRFGSTKYSIMLMFIPTGSICIMNKMFMLSQKLDSGHVGVHSALVAVILLGMNILIFYIYIKIAEDMQLKRMTAVYEKQLELCEQHLKEREIDTLHLRDVRHNMKNNLVSIRAYAESGECDKIIEFVNEVMEEGRISGSAVANSGNVVIDSLIGYWYMTAKSKGIDFSVKNSIPMKMPFKGADMCLILGNLLENAVEAAQKAEGKKYINIHMKYDKNNLLLYVSNNYAGRLLKTKDDRFRTTKSDRENHGVGIASVNRAVAKYHGTMIIDDSVPSEFMVKVVLYGEGA